jgi:peptidoglycan hydrolase-like protein with peptidoglycan-binding domain
MDVLLHAWGVEAVAGRLGSAGDGEVGRIARTNGLAHAVLAPTLGQIDLINLPVLIRLKSDGQIRWATLLKVEDDQYHLQNQDGERTMTRGELLTRYAGKAEYLWRDPNPGQESLRALSEGQTVQRVQNMLHELGILSDPGNGAYDGRTIEAVTRVQRAAGLIADGIVGYQTRMVLHAWSDTDAMPHLHEPVFSAAALQQVVRQPGLVITGLNTEAQQPVAVTEPAPPTDAASADTSEETTERPRIRLTNDSIFEDQTLTDNGSPAATNNKTAEDPLREHGIVEPHTPVLPEPEWRGEVTAPSDTNIPLVPLEPQPESGADEGQ